MDNQAAHAGPELQPAEINIELREEELRAEKKSVQVGLVRIRRELITETRAFEVTLSHEEISVERVPYEAGAASAHPQAADVRTGSAAGEHVRLLQPGETIRLPLVSEEIIVRKRPVVTAELVVGKRLLEEVQSLSGTVRREEAYVTGPSPRSTIPSEETHAPQKET